jgi:hypothetical protein
MDFTQTCAGTIVGGQIGFAVPLVISVTGHRDLVAEEVPVIRERVATFLADLRNDYPDRGVSIMSALAEGADQLVAEEALRLGIPVIVPLPMERKIYLRDFESIAVQEKFEFLSSRATPEGLGSPARHHHTCRSRSAPSARRDPIPDVSPRAGAPEEYSGETVRPGDGRITKIREIGHAKRSDQVPNLAPTNPGPRLTRSFGPDTRVQRPFSVHRASTTR